MFVSSNRFIRKSRNRLVSRHLTNIPFYASPYAAGTPGQQVGLRILAVWGTVYSFLLLLVINPSHHMHNS